MLSRKTLGVLAAVLAGLVILSWATSRRYVPEEGGGFADLLPDGVDAGSVQTVRAWLGGAPDSVVELTRRGDGWVVSSMWDWEAKEDLVTRLLEDLDGLRGERRASSAEVLADFQADDESGLHLLGLGVGDSEVFHLVVGKAARRGGTFARLAGSNDVYLTSASLRSSFGLWGEEPSSPDGRRWLQLRIFQVDRNDVERIELADGDAAFVLEKVFTEPAADSLEVDRTQWTWKPDAAGEFDKAKADGILGALSNLNASDAVDPDGADEYGLGDGARVVTLTLQDGATHTLRFGAAVEEDKKTYVRVGDDGLPARIYTSSVGRMFLSREDLKPAES